MDRVPESADGYQPHLSVAYSSSGGPSTRIVEAIDHDDVQPVTVRISHASLIELNRDHRMYQWGTVETVTLGGN